jgi:Tfp pilus assembly protein PilF
MDYLKKFKDAVMANNIEEYFQDLDRQICDANNNQLKSELIANKALNMQQIYPLRDEEAKSLAEEALKIDENNITAVRVIALYYLSKKEFNKSQEYFSLLEAKDKNDSFSKYYKATIFIELKKFDEALNYLQWINKYYDDKPIVNELNGWYFLSIGKFDDAYIHYEAALKKDPNLKQSLSYMSTYYYKKRKYTEAFDYLDKLLMITFDSKYKEQLLKFQKKIKLKIEINKINQINQIYNI